jgi:hypothetical protein
MDVPLAIGRSPLGHYHLGPGSRTASRADEEWDDQESYKDVGSSASGKATLTTYNHPFIF